MKLDITSKLAEDGLELAKGFVDKLMMPAIEETGLLLKDKISSFRFNTQLKILLKARQKCIDNKIEPKSISFKILCPLLENASFEDNEDLQDVWATLLTNLVDSKQSIDNHIFPYLLSQISIEEWEAIKNSYLAHKNNYLKELEKVVDLKEDLKLFLDQNKARLEELNELLKNTESYKVYKYRQEKYAITTQISEKEREINKIENMMNAKIYIDHQLFTKEYQVANLIRLGILKVEKEYYATSNSPKARIDGNPSSNSYYDGSIDIDLSGVEVNIDEIEIFVEEDAESEYFTKLGVLFIQSCIDRDLR